MQSDILLYGLCASNDVIVFFNGETDMQIDLPDTAISTYKEHYINKVVGERMRVRRILLNCTQQQLADLMGMNFQQIIKYENGSKCLSVSRLWDISQILKVPMSYFFDDIPPQNRSLLLSENSENKGVKLSDPMTRPEAMQLVHNYYQIPNREIAHQIFNLVDNIVHPKSKKYK